jgi:nanoRNase/pAp phosphatase (c-di-AMP/oligoRNAs hydrolase)
MTKSKSRTRQRKKPNRGQPQVNKLSGFLKLFSGSDNVLLLINPDPDSIASAFAVKRLLWKRVKKSVICSAAEILRLQNRAMVHFLRIPIVGIDRVFPQRFNRFVLLDSQPDHTERLATFKFDAIIDHHPKSGTLKAGHIDIRPEYGATASILIEYLREGGIRPSAKLATALLYAIKTDTDNFERDASVADIEQFRYVFQYANMHLLRKIENSDLKESDLRYFQNALERRVGTKKRAYTHLGKVSSPDICVQIADFFMRVYEMTWSFVSGIHENTLVIILRSDGYRKDAGKLAKRVFGSIGTAGGHRGAARAEISLDTLRQRKIGARPTDIQRFVRKRLRI